MPFDGSVRTDFPSTIISSMRHGLRVLGFCDYFPPRSSGGAERVAWEMYQRLADRGVRVEIVTASPLGDGQVSEEGGMVIWSVRSLDLSRLANAQVSLAPRLLPTAFAAVRSVRPHVLHANGLHFQTSIAATILHYLKRIPLVTTVHLGRPELLPPAVRIPTTVYERVVGRAILRASYRVVAVSRAVAEHVRSFGVPPERIRVVPNGVDVGRFRVGPDRSGPPLVLFVGRLIGNKGPQLLLRALSRLSKEGMAFRAAFVGDGPLRGRLEGLAARSGLGDRVIFTGHVVDVGSWLQLADILVRPSWTEGMSLALLEAMAAGVCVVASDVPGNVELLEGGRLGRLFPVGDEHGLTTALREVLVDGKLRNRLRMAAQAAAKTYSWDRAAGELVDILSTTAVEARSL